MTRRISRHGLIGCSACGQHVRLAAADAPQACPFCGAAVSAEAGPRRFPGRGGLIAAGLLGLSLAGCGSTATQAKDEKPAPPPSTVAPAEPPAAALYGAPPAPRDQPETPEDTAKPPPEEPGVVPLYGISPDE